MFRTGSFMVHQERGHSLAMRPNCLLELSGLGKEVCLHSLLARLVSDWAYWIQRLSSVTMPDDALQKVDSLSFITSEQRLQQIHTALLTVWRTLSWYPRDKHCVLNAFFR